MSYTSHAIELKVDRTKKQHNLIYPLRRPYDLVDDHVRVQRPLLEIRRARPYSVVATIEDTRARSLRVASLTLSAASGGHWTSHG